ncbi:MAG: hypothetical protein K0M78_03175 [Brevundimonas sp.]|nr:hypothetical protein [Brevundimonas sp.]
MGWLTVRDFGERRTSALVEDQIEQQACRFALRRQADDRGQEHRDALPAPDGDSTPGETDEAVSDALQAIGRRHGRDARFRHARLALRRQISGDGTDPVRKESEVFALTGQVGSPRGRVIPVGWSGKGSGLDQLRDEALLARLDWLVSAGDRAEPGAVLSTPAVLSTQAAAVMLHEAIGHYVEAADDPRVDLSHRLGKRIATEHFDLFDDPQAEDGAAAYGCDDEAIEVLGPTRIVEQGVVVAQLHSRQSARLAGVLSSGNGRAGVWSRPQARMSNLVCAPGSSSDPDLIERLWSGLLIHQLAHGYGQGADIEARVVLAERVERGRTTGCYLGGFRVVEKIDLFLRTVALGDQPRANPNAMCGKGGQVLFDVGTIAPSVLLSRIELRP